MNETRKRTTGASPYRVAVLVCRRLLNLLRTEDDLVYTRLDVTQLMGLSPATNAKRCQQRSHGAYTSGPATANAAATDRIKCDPSRTRKDNEGTYIVTVDQVEGLDVGSGDSASKVAQILDLSRSGSVPGVRAKETRRLHVRHADGSHHWRVLVDVHLITPNQMTQGQPTRSITSQSDTKGLTLMVVRETTMATKFHRPILR